MRRLICLFILLCLTTPVSAKYLGYDPLRGYLEDTTEQINNLERIAPPHPEYTPEPTPHKVSRRYYETNFKGRRRAYNYNPYIPDYNVWYNERREVPYSKDDYVNVWCSGKKHVNGVDCVTDNYAITFTDVKYWSYGVIKATWKARKVGKKPAVFCYVNEIGADSEYIEGAKKWGEVYNIPVFFGTIDAYLNL